MEFKSQIKKFKRRPVTIEAIQLTWDNWSEVCNFVRVPWFGGGTFIDAKGNPSRDVQFELPGHSRNQTLGMWIETKEGRMLARGNDWIIKGVNGEFYPCKAEIFAATYEEVAE